MNDDFDSQRDDLDELLKKYRTNLSCGKRSENPCKSCNANGTLHGENSKKAWDKYYVKI